MPFSKRSPRHSSAHHISLVMFPLFRCIIFIPLSLLLSLHFSPLFSRPLSRVVEAPLWYSASPHPSATQPLFRWHQKFLKPRIARNGCTLPVESRFHVFPPTKNASALSASYRLLTFSLKLSNLWHFVLIDRLHGLIKKQWIYATPEGIADKIVS